MQLLSSKNINAAAPPASRKTFPAAAKPTAKLPPLPPRVSPRPGAVTSPHQSSMPPPTPRSDALIEKVSGFYVERGAEDVSLSRILFLTCSMLIQRAAAAETARQCQIIEVDEDFCYYQKNFATAGLQLMHFC